MVRTLSLYCTCQPANGTANPRLKVLQARYVRKASTMAGFLKSCPKKYEAFFVLNQIFQIQIVSKSHFVVGNGKY